MKINEYSININIAEVFANFERKSVFSVGKKKMHNCPTHNIRSFSANDS